MQFFEKGKVEYFIRIPSTNTIAVVRRIPDPNPEKNNDCNNKCILEKPLSNIPNSLSNGVGYCSNCESIIVINTGNASEENPIQILPQQSV